LADALKRLGNAISDIEKQALEIEQYKDVLKHISDIKLEAQKTADQSTVLIERQSSVIADNLKFIEDCKGRFAEQHFLLEELKKKTGEQISNFSHEFIEKTSILRDESLNAHIDLRQDIERLNKSQKQLDNSMTETNELITKVITENSKELVNQLGKLDDMVLEQSKKIKWGNYWNGLITLFLVTLLTLQLFPMF
jgi:hypothetical protein